MIEVLKTQLTMPFGALILAAMFWVVCGILIGTSLMESWLRKLDKET